MNSNRLTGKGLNFRHNNVSRSRLNTYSRTRKLSRFELINQYKCNNYTNMEKHYIYL